MERRLFILLLDFIISLYLFYLDMDATGHIIILSKHI